MLQRENINFKTQSNSISKKEIVMATGIHTFKCVCGYQYRHEAETSKGVILPGIGDESFIRLQSINRYSEKFVINIFKEFLYACPKCGTIQIAVEGNREFIQFKAE